MGKVPSVKAGGLMIEEGGVIRPALLNRLPGDAAYKHGVVPQMARHFGVAVLAPAHGNPMNDLHIFILLIIPHQRVYQHGGLVGRVAKKDPGAVGNVLHSLIRRNQFGFIEFPPIVHNVRYLLENDVSVQSMASKP